MVSDSLQGNSIATALPDVAFREAISPPPEFCFIHRVISNGDPYWLVRKLHGRLITYAPRKFSVSASDGWEGG